MITQTEFNANVARDAALAREVFGVCGCGRTVQYQTPSGMACNKYARCSPVVSGTTVTPWTDEQKEELRVALEAVFGHPITRDTP